jgi:hypothetical protein
VGEPRFARRRRKRIKKVIRDLDKKHPNQHSDSEFALPGAVALLSDPQHEHLLPFPIIRMGTPIRFTVDKKYRWQYIGREKFTELLSEFRLVQKESKYKRLWIYGTSGYGKSHLLAALVCYLTALGERVIYIRDCGTFIENPVEHL